MMSGPALIAQIEIPVRFCEIDPLSIVWHGHYLKYFEEAREAFGRKYGLGYLDVYSNGFTTPLISMTLEYKKPLVYGDRVLAEVIYVDSPAAKILFEYRAYNAATKELVATGRSAQVFITVKNAELHMTIPDFFLEWKKSVGLKL